MKGPIGRILCNAIGGFAAGLCFVPAGSAIAIVADPRPRACAAYSNADMVLTGTVGAGRVTDRWTIWTVKVDRSYKGKVPATFMLYSENSSARATPDEGARNMLFVHRQGDRLVAWGSDPNLGGADAVPVERHIRRISSSRPGSTGSVIGLVATEGGQPRGHWPVRFRDADAGSTRIARTDRAGRFSIQLPPGRWTAKVIQPGWNSRGSVYGYSNPDGFTLKGGGCADLRLEPIRQGA